MALRTIRAQKLKSFFSLIGVLIGVTFLIAVVSIVQGMNRYMVDRFANTLIGANTFELRQRPSIVTGQRDRRRCGAQWRRRPRISYERRRLRRASAPDTPATFAKLLRGPASPVHYEGEGGQGHRPRRRPRRPTSTSGTTSVAAGRAFSAAGSADGRCRCWSSATSWRQKLLPDRRSDRQVGADRRASLPDHRRGGEAGHAVRSVARQVRRHAVQCTRAAG